MRRLAVVAILALLWALVGVPALVLAQATPEPSPDGSPGPASGPVSACRVDAVAVPVTVPTAPVEVPTDPAATPGSAAADTAPADPPEGPAVDEGTVADLQATLDELAACAAEGDVGKVAALFTEAGLERAVLAEEPVRIELLEDGATPAPVPGDDDRDEGSPWLITPTVQPGLVDRAVELEDGSVAAVVDPASPAPRLVVFVRDDTGSAEGARWRIDDIRPLAPDVSDGTPTAGGTDAPLGAEDLPAEVWDAVVVTLGLTGDATITVLGIEAVDWPDSALGCPADGEFYAQVITPGYRLLLEVDGTRTELHTDTLGNAVTCPRADTRATPPSL